MKRVRWIVMLMLVGWVAVTGEAVAGADAKPEDKPTKGEKVEKVEGRVNINLASKAELMKLTGVGPSTAERIIAHRESHGPFKRVQDLKKVEGVGKGVLEKNLDRLAVK